MNTELNDLLCEYLGELLYQLDNTFDWIQKDAIIRKMNAVHVLLDLPRKESEIEKLISVYKEVTRPDFDKVMDKVESEKYSKSPTKL